MIPVLDARQMAKADRMAIRAGVASAKLMENAAAALTRELLETFPGARSVVVACGPGNNGGDGLAAARMLDGRGLSVSVFTLGDPSTYGGDAADNAQRARQAGLALSPLSAAGALSAFRRGLAGADVVVDALFGTGLSRPLSGGASRAVSAMTAAARPVVAADIPSGLSADSGELIGPCVRADVTVAFAAPKRAHVLFPARGRCGRVAVADIGIPREILAAQESPLRMTESDDIAALFAPRPADSHKGAFGRLAIVAGSGGKAGASILAARGALRAGAGLVTVFCPSTIAPLVVGALPETMTHGLPDRDGALAEEGARELLSALADFDAVVAGPGLTTAPGVAALLERLLRARLALLCDADALNAFSGRPGVFARRRAPTVLTPHPGEAGRLLGTSGRDVQKDRIASAARLARESRSVALLKGASSLIAAPSGRLTVNPTGTPLMATAGSGDVLSGAIGAFLAGGMDAEDAAIAGAYLHGAAGERLARDLGDAGLLAHELADALPMARRALGSGNGKRVNREVLSRNESETERLGRRLAASLSPGDVVYLIGNLGAGKTCLARGLAMGLGASSREVASPSFAILHEYAGPGGEIVLRHLDLYRLQDSENELAILGLPGSVAGAPVAVEWPGETIRKLLPPTVEVRIEVLPDGNRRIRENVKRKT